MRPIPLLALALAPLALAAPASADPDAFGTVTTVQVAKGRVARAALLADVDGDGADDLVLATSRRGPRAERSVLVFLRRAGDAAFAPSADLEFELPTDVTAIAAGDVHADPGAEIVLFSATGAFALRTRGPEDARFVRLATASFLWQLPDARDVIAWEDGVRDVDGDGLDDLVLPEPGGWTLALQRRSADAGASFPVVSAPRVPDDPGGAEAPMGDQKMEVRATRREVRIAVTLGDGEAGGGDLVQVAESAPAPQFEDFDGDGRADLLAQSARELLVWRQRADGRFPEAPDTRLELPVRADRERRLDVSYGAHTADLDGDRRADCVFFAGDRRASDVRTQVLVYSQAKSGTAEAPLFGPEGLPAQLLRVGGFAGGAQLVDVDGDGRRDLVYGAVRLDGALDAVRASREGSLDAQVYVHRNRGAAFSDRPELLFDVTVPAEGLRKRRELTARFVGDVTGDRVRELLLRDSPETVKLLMTRRAGDALAIVSRPLWEMRVHEDARMVVRERRDAPTELLVIEDAQVLHVRWP